MLNILEKRRIKRDIKILKLARANFIKADGEDNLKYVCVEISIAACRCGFAYRGKVANPLREEVINAIGGCNTADLYMITSMKYEGKVDNVHAQAFRLGLLDGLIAKKEALL